MCAPRQSPHHLILPILTVVCLLCSSAIAQSTSSSNGVIPTPEAIPHGMGPVVEVTGSTTIGRLGSVPVAGTASSTSSAMAAMMTSSSMASSGMETMSGGGINSVAQINGGAINSVSSLFTPGVASSTTVALETSASATAMMSASTSGSGANTLLTRGDGQDIQGLVVEFVAVMVGCVLVGGLGVL